jgi:hypothetical protein
LLVMLPRRLIECMALNAPTPRVVPAPIVTFPLMIVAITFVAAVPSVTDNTPVPVACVTRFPKIVSV